MRINHNQYISLKAGFTLIELLVVIAIIGILSAVVLASLVSARSKGQDAAVKADLHAVVSQAEIAYATLGNSYGTPVPNSAVCSTLSGAGTLFSDTTIQRALKAAKSAVGADSSCNVTSSAYVIAAPMTGGAAWCIDSVGNSRSTTAAGVPYNGLIGAAPAAFVSGTTVCN